MKQQSFIPNEFSFIDTCWQFSIWLSTTTPLKVTYTYIFKEYKRREQEQIQLWVL